MKRAYALFLLVLLASSGLQRLHAAQPPDGAEQEEADELDPRTGFPVIKNKPFPIFTQGVTYAMVTRIEDMEKYNRSNFVRQDHLIGAFFAMQSVNMRPVNSMLRVSVYYPFLHTFNGMEQFPKQVILYAFDLFAGPMIQTDMWKYVRLNFAGGLHYMYQLSDEYHLNYLGGALVVGTELPIARHWTIVNNGTVTLDYPNLGTNQKVQPFSFAWQYQLELGFRYSKKNSNRYSYIHHLEGWLPREKNLERRILSLEAGVKKSIVRKHNKLEAKRQRMEAREAARAQEPAAEDEEQEAAVQGTGAEESLDTAQAQENEEILEAEQPQETAPDAPEPEAQDEDESVEDAQDTSEDSPDQN